MAMWVCRSGTDAKHYDAFKYNNVIFLAWDGFDINLNSFTDKNDLRAYVINERHTDNRTSVSNWIGQLISFSKEMKSGEYVLIPNRRSRTYSLAKIIGDYEYRKFPNTDLYHSHDIEFLYHDIPREIFDQDIVYSLGAYRTLFKVREEKRVLDTIKKHCQL